MKEQQLQGNFSLECGAYTNILVLNSACPLHQDAMAKVNKIAANLRKRFLLRKVIKILKIVSDTCTQSSWLKR